MWSVSHTSETITIIQDDWVVACWRFDFSLISEGCFEAFDDDCRKHTSQ
jgi:hypothetical protein